MYFVYELSFNTSVPSSEDSRELIINLFRLHFDINFFLLNWKAVVDSYSGLFNFYSTIRLHFFFMMILSLREIGSESDILKKNHRNIISIA